MKQGFKDECQETHHKKQYPRGVWLPTRLNSSKKNDAKLWPEKADATAV